MYTSPYIKGFFNTLAQFTWLILSPGQISGHNFGHFSFYRPKAASIPNLDFTIPTSEEPVLNAVNEPPQLLYPLSLCELVHGRGPSLAPL